jgi:hypothetical protein
MSRLRFEMGASRILVRSIIARVSSHSPLGNVRSTETHAMQLSVHFCLYILKLRINPICRNICCIHVITDVTNK